jgi:hypothetical protein
MKRLVQILVTILVLPLSLALIAGIAADLIQERQNETNK